ncbi:MAG: hypoxanthine phosphoribosyltransferase [Verrucomicrobia bacterium GWC2_42_7]|nr:MAG: hypoxanthine phosphoribosyltransferase [Verrucomicrobia bacterium GWC2_42_7]
MNNHSVSRSLSKILISESDIQLRLKSMGQEIIQYSKSAGIDELTVISITNGSIVFTADLIRQIDLPLKLDCIRISSYQSSCSAVTEPKVIHTIRLDIQGKHILLLDDILDTGKTLRCVKDLLNALNPASLKVAVLLDKKERREVKMEADFVGFNIPNEFVVGYGLDFAEYYRNLPCIGILAKELQPQK